MAAAFTAPLEDMRFVLNQLVDLGRLAEGQGYDSVSADLVDQILEQGGRFASSVVAPLNQPGDRIGAQMVNGVVRMPEGFADAYRRYVEAGWGAVSASPEYGGQGLPWTINTALGELWQAANMSLADGWMLTQGAVELLERHGTPEQQRNYLPKLATGAWSGTMNLTEPGAGSDVGALRTRAVRVDGGWRITGTKIFITHGDQDMSANVIHMVLARTAGAPAGVKGISLFLVPKLLVGADGRPGAHNDLRVVSLEHKLGHMASPTCVMAYGDTGGAVGQLIGKENHGIEYMFIMMNNARLHVGVQGLAIAERAYQAARQWARERVQGRALGSRSDEPVPIIRHPDVRRMLIEMKAQTEAMRALCYFAAEALDLARRHPDAALRARKQALCDLLIPVVKGWCTDQGFEMASTGIQIHGGMGYIEETGAAQYLRDARVTMIYEGTNGIQALDLVRRKLAQDGGDTAAKLIAEMRATAALLGQRPSVDLAAIRARLAPSLSALENATRWMARTFPENPVAAAAGATPYMRMLGFTVGGWLMAKAALAAGDRLAEGASNRPFLKAKITTARFFAEHYLPQAEALLGPVTTAHKTVMALDEAAF